MLSFESPRFGQSAFLLAGGVKPGPA